MDEQLLWKYIEGEASETERTMIEKAFSENEDLRRSWEERKLLHTAMQDLELEEPSMRFTQNVMDNLPKMYAYNISKKWLRNLGIVLLASSLIPLLSLFFLKPSTASSTSSFFKDVLSNSGVFGSFFPSEYILLTAFLTITFLLLFFLDKIIASNFSKANFPKKVGMNT